MLVMTAGAVWGEVLPAPHWKQKCLWRKVRLVDPTLRLSRPEISPRLTHDRLQFGLLSTS